MPARDSVLAFRFCRQANHIHGDKIHLKLFQAMTSNVELTFVNFARIMRSIQKGEVTIMIGIQIGAVIMIQKVIVRTTKAIKAR